MIRLSTAGLSTMMLVGVLITAIGLQVSSCSPGQAASERSPGEVAFRNSCQSCHSLPKPSQKPDTEWPALVARYGQKAKLNEEKIRQITEYLVDAN